MDDLAQQRVPEAVAALRVGVDEMRLGGLAQRGAQRGRIQAARLGEHVVRHAAAGGEQAQELLRGLPEALDAHHQRVPQRRRQRAAPVEPRGEQLLGEQRVALAAAEEARDELRVGVGAEDVGELLGELVLGQRLERDPARARVALELGQDGTQRMAAVQLVGPVRRDDEHALGPQAAGEERQERARRAVGPVDVLDPEDERLLLAEAVEQREQRLEQLRLGELGAGRRARAVPQLREQRPELPARGRPDSSSRTGSRSRASPRRTPTIGAYGSSSPPSSTQSPHSTRAPRSRASAASAPSRRDFPTPDSPAMNASDGRPSAASDERGAELGELGAAPDETGCS